MVETLSRAEAPLLCIQSLLETQQAAGPNKEIWQEVLSVWENLTKTSQNVMSADTFKLIIKFDISKRLDSLGVTKWREEIESSIDKTCIIFHEREERTKSVYSKLVSYEQLKEATSLLELVLWKVKIDESILNNRESSQKLARIDSSSHRYQCRINSGAEIVVPGVLPYFLPA